MQPAVLLADNDVAVSSLLAEVLRRGGFAVRQAFDGEAALAALAEATPDLLVCDLDMPKKSGLLALEELGTRPTQPPTLVITGYLDAGVLQRLRALPFVCDVLRKPFDLAGFVVRLRQLVAAAAAAPAVPAASEPGAAAEAGA